MLDIFLQNGNCESKKTITPLTKHSASFTSIATNVKGGKSNQICSCFVNTDKTFNILAEMTERLIPSPNTLVKYDNPILITKHELPSTSGDVSEVQMDLLTFGEEFSGFLLPMIFAGRCGYGQEGHISCWTKTRNWGNFEHYPSAERMGRRWATLEAASFHYTSYSTRRG